MRTTEHKASACPVCGKHLDASTSLTAEASPKPGDLTVCIACAAALVFRDDLTVTRLGQVERDSLSAEELLDLARTQSAVHEANRRARRS